MYFFLPPRGEKKEMNEQSALTHHFGLLLYPCTNIGPAIADDK